MNPSPSHPKQTRAAHQNDRQATASADSSAALTSAAPLSDRPVSTRLPPRRLTNIVPSGHDDEVEESTSEAEQSDEDGLRNLKYAATPPSTDATAGRKGRSKPKSPQEEQIAQLREAVAAKLLLQQRMRGSQPDVSGRYSPASEELSRPMPPAQAPSFAASAASDQTTSTESTESARTVRGSVPVTPAGTLPARTPSYPFPYVPATPKAWSLHQPFTTLSPTILSRTPDRIGTPEDTQQSTTSDVGTPTAGTGSAFAPPGAAALPSEDPRFPNPNLYDMVLQLNAEPGLDAWWSNLARIVHEQFKAERATLAMPADPTDLENVPWGQKATFSMNGPEEFVSHRTVIEQTMGGSRVPLHAREEATVETPGDLRPRKLHPERLRPTLESRHSYAGHSRNTKEYLADSTSKHGARPKGPRRTVTHAHGVPGGVGPGRPPPPHVPSSDSIRHTSVTDPDFSTVAGGMDAGPNTQVFQALRTLDHESHPLIETSGIHRILSLGRVVAVTRDYTTDPSEDSDSRASDTPGWTPGPSSAFASFKPSRSFSNYRHMLASENLPVPKREYEEYEQVPSSPWAQSPAPSPAIQSDEEQNPFFASEEQQIEDSFNPVSSPKDYSQYNQVEAIGVDLASTIIHVPLVHPTLSQPMQSLRMKAQDQEEKAHVKRSNTIDYERRSPIAVLSILSSTVPYPPNLIASLKLLGPHLATSFALAQQFTYTNLQVTSIRHRRSASGHLHGQGPAGIDVTSLDDIVKAELEDLPTSMTGSLTSPSDYSGRSTYSPSSSIAGTPGWDRTNRTWATLAGTPGLLSSEAPDGYFDAKPRGEQRAPGHGAPPMRTTPVKPTKRPDVQEGKAGVKRDDNSHQSETKPRTASTTKEGRHHNRTTLEVDFATPLDHSTPSQKQFRNPSMASIHESSDKRHSVLHSYGADYQASFGTVSAEAGMHGTASHVRKSSVHEDMPPPSERLLRTIIDSLPVQIFTAAPDTGRLTWVNSKFLIYRGKDSRQVLSEPWQAIHPEDRKEYMDTWSRCLKTGQQLQQKVRLQRFDGDYRWFYVRAAPLKDRRHQTVHWIGTNMDFHEQHMAEVNSARQQETAASEAKYRALANSSPQVVFAVSRTKGVTFCNSQWISYSGQPESQALKVGFMDHVHPDDIVKCRLPVFDDESDQPTNVPTSMPPEPRRTVSTSAASSSDSSETDKTSSGSEANASPVVNMPQRKLSQLASTGILKVSRDADGRPSYTTEVRLKSKDGEFRWHLVRVLLAEGMHPSGEHGEEEIWYGTCTDINDHKTLERDLKETMDEKSRFLSNMSHEIRTPLNGITGMVNFLIDSNLTTEQMEHVNIIRASTEGLRGLINDILDLSKAEAGMIQLNMDWMYVRDLIEEVNDLTSTMAVEKGLELNYIVEQDVPSQIKGDRFRIRQILLNIVGNGIKFTQRGEVLVRCSILKDDTKSLPKGEIFIRFDVVDTGRGFTDKEAEALFKRFSQIDGSSTRQHGGTGLGLVISQQLTQLHGGEMSAKGSPGKGSTFTFFIKTSLPTNNDQPPTPMATPGAANIPVLPFSPGLFAPISTQPLHKTAVPFAAGDKPFNRSAAEYALLSASPHDSPDLSKDSPGVSSASSDPSIRSATRTASIRSGRSSVSSYGPESIARSSSPIKLSLPLQTKTASSGVTTAQLTFGTKSAERVQSAQGQSSVVTPLTTIERPTSPLMFSIMVVAPLRYTREATVQHIEKTLPKNIPHQITARGDLDDCLNLLGGEEPVTFSHVVVVLQDDNEIIALMNQILRIPAHSSTIMVIITDLSQRRRIAVQAPDIEYKTLEAQGRLFFIFKPLKPARFGAIFDPRKEREMSTDRAQDSAQQVVVTQKQVFEELTKRLGNKDKRVLLVEDNKVNQMVILKFFSKIAIQVETVMDGVQCTDKVFAQPFGYYSIILCDLHMPNKDGYHTCKEIRKWEKKKEYKHLPIIALSANVLGDVYQKCVDAGFNSYITKPVDFKELSTVLMTFMDPSDPSKPHEFMKTKGKGRSAAGARK